MAATKRVSIMVVCVFLASPLAGSSKAFCCGSTTNIFRVRQCGGSKKPDCLVETPKNDRNLHFLSELRGGASKIYARKQEKGDASDSQDDRDSVYDKRRRRGMAVALTSTYLTVMGAKCALPSVLSLLTATKTGLAFPMGTAANIGILTPQSHMAKLLGLSTLAVAMGKLLLGPVIDTLGGIRSLQLALASLALSLATISFSQQFSVFAFCWIFVDFVFSSCWAGCINAIHQSFPEKEWGRQIGRLAAGARTGNAAAFALFATMLYALEDKMRQPWRVIFGFSALLQIIPFALLTRFGGMPMKEKIGEGLSHNHPDGEEKATFKSSLRTLRREAGTPEFWLHLISRSSLMVFASFLLFVPTLMSQVYGSSNAFAAQTGSIYALGCLLSVTFGSEPFSNLPRKKQALASFLLMTAATLSSLMQLGHVTGTVHLSDGVSAASFFLWGLAFSIPFYIPPSLYALARGGKQSSATIADVFDIGGFSLLAVFNGYVASINHANPQAWIRTFQLTTGFALTSLVSLTLAVLRQ